MRQQEYRRIIARAKRRKARARELKGRGMTISEIARRLDVSRQRIQQILKGV